MIEEYNSIFVTGNWTKFQLLRLPKYYHDGFHVGFTQFIINIKVRILHIEHVRGLNWIRNYDIKYCEQYYYFIALKLK